MSEEERDIPLITPMIIDPILQRLKIHLNTHRDSYTDRSYANDGCDTCNYGAAVIEEMDFDKLCAEIDAFGEEIRKGNIK